ncbi:hypothetical protein OQY15_11655 [Pedobacter sp. MC2016-15]|uniref:hypothetical protein n=1 Tax=Pedobacter sp. MC2016-15 TaxID=2994473 RepID=UPI002245627F|nr:hypothetical protein [Pedobacter sp. MC2016-15]MCX2479743.1 hypothetical protein [Pedobacter sp. MC2016-15]
MIWINKGVEPIEWSEKKATPGFTKYEPIPALRDALLEEQKNICAYCMRRIPVKDAGITESSKIEHLKSRHRHPALDRDYNNMVVCCPGSIDGSAHCDKSKAHEDLTFSPFNTAVQKSIAYSTKDGTIKSSTPSWDTDINNVLCLNNARLKETRAKVIEGVQKVLSQKKFSAKELNKMLTDWSTPTAKGYKPFCGVVIWYIEKKLKLLK